MNKMELKTHECLQFFLPRIAVALEEIAKELKKQNKEALRELDLKHVDRSEAYHMIREAGITVIQDEEGDVVFPGGDLLIGEGVAYLVPVKRDYGKISTSSEAWILTSDLTVEHINQFIVGYKALEGEENSK